MTALTQAHANTNKLCSRKILCFEYFVPGLTEASEKKEKSGENSRVGRPRPRGIKKFVVDKLRSATPVRLINSRSRGHFGDRAPPSEAALLQ